MQQRKKQVIKKNSCLLSLKRYLANSSIHGVKYIVEEGRHWTERLFWFIACCVSWCICLIMIYGIWDQYSKRKVDITMETNYLRWEAEFPSIFFCVSYSKAAHDYTKTVIGLDRNRDKLLHWQYLGYISGIKKIPTLEHLIHADMLVQPNCHDFFGTCAWNDELIDCCRIFQPLKTTAGHCLAFNSYHAVALPNDNYPLPRFVVNHNVKMARLTLMINSTDFSQFSTTLYTKVYMMDRIEIPLQTSGYEKLLGVNWEKTTYTVDINAIPTYNEPEVLSLSPETRGCRTITEPVGNLFLKYYSYEGCQMENQIKASLDSCGCVSHVFPFNENIKVCNWTELACIKQNKDYITRKRKDNCLPDCDETVIEDSRNALNDSTLPDWTVGKFVFNMLPGPTLRYRRSLSHSTLDLIVAVGSTLGLFVGASVLSVVEIPYWLFLRTKN